MSKRKASQRWERGISEREAGLGKTCVTCGRWKPLAEIQPYRGAVQPVSHPYRDYCRPCAALQRVLRNKARRLAQSRLQQLYEADYKELLDEAKRQLMRRHQAKGVRA